MFDFSGGKYTLPAVPNYDDEPQNTSRQDTANESTHLQTYNADQLVSIKTKIISAIHVMWESKTEKTL